MIYNDPRSPYPPNRLIIQNIYRVCSFFFQETNLLYLFWESTSELSVLDLKRHTLRSLAPLPPEHNLTSRQHARVHAGLCWVGGRLYVVGGFSEFVGGDRRPTLPRDDVHCYDPVTDTWYVYLSYS